MTLHIRPENLADITGIEALTSAALREQGAAGCVVLGDPAYYGRFGFKAEPDLRLEAVPPQYFMAQAFGTALPRATVTYHPAFNAQG
jgi:putative acetyltransferase